MSASAALNAVKALGSTVSPVVAAAYALGFTRGAASRAAPPTVEISTIKQAVSSMLEIDDGVKLWLVVRVCDAVAKCQWFTSYDLWSCIPLAVLSSSFLS